MLPQWSREVGPWLEIGVCTWPAGDLGPEINLRGLQRLNVGLSTVSPPTSKQAARDGSSPQNHCSPGSTPKPVIHLSLLFTPLSTLQPLLLGSLRVSQEQSWPPGSSLSPPFRLVLVAQVLAETSPFLTLSVKFPATFLASVFTLT